MIIKRYPNRKLYDTGAAKYITYKEIADRLRQGVEVRIEDSVSGANITSQVIARVIAVQGKDQNGLIPLLPWEDLTHAGGVTLEGLHRFFRLNLGINKWGEDEIHCWIETLFQEVSVPTKTDIQTLIEQIELLEKIIEKMIKNTLFDPPESTGKPVIE